MAYQYTLTPALKKLVDEANKNKGLLFRSQVKMIVSNDKSSFYKLKKLGYTVKQKPIGKIGKNYCVEIIDPKRKFFNAIGVFLFWYLPITVIVLAFFAFIFQEYVR